MIEIAPVTPERWDDLADLFQRKGPRGGKPVTDSCWCMWWRARTGDRERNKRAMEALVREGREPGLLAYEAGVAVGWVSVGPREEFEQLVRSRTYRPPADERGVWSLVCFYVPRSLRRQGVMERLIQASVEHARARGAAVVEAYPVDPDSPSYRYMGFVPVFERAGFEHVGRAGTRRHVMRLRVGDRPGDEARREPRGEARSG